MKRRFNEAESYGWVVEDWKAREAYDLACEHMGKEYVDDQIVDCLSSEELAQCLVHLFRNWDFREWEDYKNEMSNEFEESVNRKDRNISMKESKASGKFHGISDMTYVWHNTQSDPGVIYDGKYFNAGEIDDTLWEMFEEYCAETGVINDYDMFDQWVSENEDVVYEIIDNLIEYGDYEDVDEVSGVGPFRGGWRTNGDFIYGESKSMINRRQIREARRDMSPQYDSRKSFYGKAHVVDDEDGTLTLYSYNTPVCEIKDGKVKLLAMWDSSQTTLRHVKEFLKQNGYEAGSKQSIAKMYGESLRRKGRRISERLTASSVGFDDVSSSVRPTKHGYEVEEYVPEEGYQTFSKTCGDFDVMIYSLDDAYGYTVYVNPKRGNVDLNWLESELEDIDFTDENALDVLDDRLMALSGRGAKPYGESRQRRNRRSGIRTESVRRKNRKFRK